MDIPVDTICSRHTIKFNFSPTYIFIVYIHIFHNSYISRAIYRNEKCRIDTNERRDIGAVKQCTDMRVL